MPGGRFMVLSLLTRSTQNCSASVPFSRNAAFLPSGLKRLPPASWSSAYQNHQSTGTSKPYTLTSAPSRTVSLSAAARNSSQVPGTLMPLAASMSAL